MIKFGYKSEKKFCEILNDKFINQLEEKYMKLLEIVFEKNLDSKTYIACWKSFKTDKADIIIRAGKIKKYISIKSGKNNSIHLESLHDFKRYLKELNFPEELIKIYEKYHYIWKKIKD